MKKQKTPFMRVIGALQDIRKMLEKQSKASYNLGKKAHEARHLSEYDYGHAVGGYRKVREITSLVRKIVEKM